MTTQQMADMANRAEKEILNAMTAEMRDWYLSLPRERRVQIAEQAFADMLAQAA